MKKQFPIFLIVAALVALVGYFWLVRPLGADLNIGPRFDWPDETANYFWSKSYSQTGELTLAEPMNIAAHNQIHPRSFNVRTDGSLVPGSFLGLILLYGTLAKVFSLSSLIYFTPIFSVLAVLAFYGIVKRIFNERIALISALLMLFHPAWWYYSVTSMLPNVAFVAFLIFSIYFVLKNHHPKLVDVLLGGFFLGISLSIRPSEIIWVGFIYLVLLAYRRDNLRAKNIILLLVITAAVMAPAIYQQKVIYGDYLASGYNQLDEITPSCQTCQIVKSVIAPFGFHPQLMAVNFWTHFISRFWWWSLLAILGLIAFLFQTSKQRIEVFFYMLISMFVFAWLGIYYGSWQFTDLLTVHLNTLGLSYVRYWLPLYILVLPFVAIGLTWLTNFFKNRVKVLALAVLIGALLYQSADLVLVKKPDSILPVKERILDYRKTAARVFDVVPEDAVIVTVRKDKVFFPDRRVIHTFDALSVNQELLGILPDLVSQVPVYYYALGPEPEVEFSNGLKLETVETIGQEILYQVK
ncbi:MAG: glycosyltransferase family 39 protein [Candidatus Buchananbacteria bacterium]|nr:glycosyltransferase family 39 protein [Candidatus Buchananbacteria bacterium]